MSNNSGIGINIPSITTAIQQAYFNKMMKSKSKIKTMAKIIEGLPKVPTSLGGVFECLSESAASSKKGVNSVGYQVGDFFVTGEFSQLPIFEKGFRTPLDYVQYLEFTQDRISSQIGHLADLSSGSSIRPVNIMNYKFSSEEHVKNFAQDLVDMGFIKTFQSTMVRLNEKNLPIMSISGSMEEDDCYQITAVFSKYEDVLPVLESLKRNGEIRAKEAVLTFVTGIDNRGNLILKKETLKDGGFRRAHPSFYPWMEGMSPTEYFMEFMESRANVLMLYGVHGSGKSTMISTACADLGLSALIVTDAALASNPNFIAKLGETMNSDKEGTETFDVLIIEDGDALMAPRTQGNLGLSSILTATDGIGNTRKFKLVTTTNAKSTENIDPALLRPGRCFDIMQFGVLTPKEATVVREDLGLPPHKFTRPAPLASILNPSIKVMTSAQDADLLIVSPRFPLKR